VPDEERELPLTGGGLTDVVRVGDTVRRPMRPWSEPVHALLRHLQGCGLATAPAFRGADAQGREILSCIDGDGGIAPIRREVASDEALVRAAEMIRELHDASATFAWPNDHDWQKLLRDPTGSREVVCHNDLSTYNLIYREGLPVGVVDWDFAAPGSRLWDLAYAAWWLVPLHHPAYMRTVGWPDIDQPRRLRLLCDAYGLDDRSALLDTIHLRQRRNQDQLRIYVVTGVTAAYDATDPTVECGMTDYLDGRRNEFERALR
jgi:hypothetical protein